jgi:hypothetical protein
MLFRDKIAVLGFFAKLKKAAISSAYLSLYPFVGVEQLGYQWMDFHDFLQYTFVGISFEKFQVSLEPENNNGYFT